MGKMFKSARVTTHEVASVPATSKTKAFISDVAKDGRDAGLLENENKDRLYALDEDLPEYALLQKAVANKREADADCDRFLESKRRAVEEAEARGDRMAKLEAESALKSALETVLEKRNEAQSAVTRGRIAWTNACSRKRREAEHAGHLDYFREILSGEQPIDKTYRSSVGSYEHKTVDLCRWLANASFGVIAILAKEAIDSGQLPYAERVAQVSAEYLRANEYRIACNRDRPAGGHINFGTHAVEQACDQVSQEELDAKCAEFGRVPSNDEIRAMYKGPGRDEKYFAEAAANAAEASAKAEARRNTLPTKQLSVQEVIARGHSMKV